MNPEKQSLPVNRFAQVDPATRHDIVALCLGTISLHLLQKYRSSLINDLKAFVLERAMGIEPTALAWEARVLPLYDAREGRHSMR